MLLGVRVPAVAPAEMMIPTAKGCPKGTPINLHCCQRWGSGLGLGLLRWPPWDRHPQNPMGLWGDETLGREEGRGVLGGWAGPS